MSKGSGGAGAGGRSGGRSDALPTKNGITDSAFRNAVNRMQNAQRGIDYPGSNEETKSALRKVRDRAIKVINKYNGFA